MVLRRGQSAIAEYLDNARVDNDLLLDAGGLREPGRSDPLLERYIDQAVLTMRYSGLVAAYPDMRDGISEFRQREKRVPLHNSGISSRRGNSVMMLSSGNLTVAVATFAGKTERSKLEKLPRRAGRAADAETVARNLAEADADIRILVVRGGLDDLDAETAPADLVVFSGEDSPAWNLEKGGRTGGQPPWLALAPRGNGLARVVFNTSKESAEPSVQIELVPLERGVSPESPEILQLGEKFMDALTRQALAAAAEKRGGKNGLLSSTADRETVETTYWYPYGCRECEDFLWNVIPSLEDETGKEIVVVEKNSSDPDDFDILLAELSKRNAVLSAVPVLIVENRVFQGNQNIHAGFADYLDQRRIHRPAAIIRELPRRWQRLWEPGCSDSGRASGRSEPLCILGDGVSDIGSGCCRRVAKENAPCGFFVRGRCICYLYACGRGFTWRFEADRD